jgi:heme oxygenase
MDSVMLMLRDGTAADHAAAEGQPFQRALAKGRVTREAYAAYLAQLLPVHEALETRLGGSADARVGRIVTADQAQTANLRADLEVLESGVAEPAEATRKLVRAIRAERDGAALLGSLYVLEGSKNGGSFIARALRKSLGFEAGRGDRYFDPHGTRQREVWAEFKARMDTEAWDQAERAKMLLGAAAMFRAIQEVSIEVGRRFLAEQPAATP